MASVASVLGFRSKLHEDHMMCSHPTVLGHKGGDSLVPVGHPGGLSCQNHATWTLCLQHFAGTARHVMAGPRAQPHGGRSPGSTLCFQQAPMTSPVSWDPICWAPTKAHGGRGSQHQRRLVSGL